MKEATFTLALRSHSASLLLSYLALVARPNSTIVGACVSEQIVGSSSICWCVVCVVWWVNKTLIRIWADGIVRLISSGIVGFKYQTQPAFFLLNWRIGPLSSLILLSLIKISKMNNL